MAVKKPLLVGTLLKGAIAHLENLRSKSTPGDWSTERGRLKTLERGEWGNHTNELLEGGDELGGSFTNPFDAHLLIAVGNTAALDAQLELLKVAKKTHKGSFSLVYIPGEEPILDLAHAILSH